MCWVKKWIDVWMNGWKEGRNQGKSIQLSQGAFSKQANHFQIYQTMFSIKKKANIPGKYSCIFYTDPEHYKWQEIQRKVKSTLCTPMAIEEGLKNVEQSRKHLGQIIILKNKDTRSSVQSFYLKKNSLCTFHDLSTLPFDISSKEEFSSTDFK